MRQLTRFSLRALLAMVTLSCLLLSYGANWRHQRHLFLADQKQRGADEAMRPFALPRQTMMRIYSVSEIPLLAAGEMRYRRLAIIIPESDTTFRPTTHYTDTLDTQPDYARAKRLFPEATLMLFKPKTKNGGPVIVSVRNSVTGEVISGIEDGDDFPSKYPPDHL